MGRGTTSLLVAMVLCFGSVQVVFSGAYKANDLKRLCEFAEERTLDEGTKILWDLSCMNYVDGAVTG